MLNLQKLLGIWKCLSRHWILHVNSFYWALDHILSFTVPPGWIGFSLFLWHEKLKRINFAFLPIYLENNLDISVHFRQYISRTSGISLCSGISCFSPACNSLTLTFQINSASKPGCATKSKDVIPTPVLNFAHFMAVDYSRAMACVSTTFVAFTAPFKSWTPNPILPDAGVFQSRNESLNTIVHLRPGIKLKSCVLYLQDPI